MPALMIFITIPIPSSSSSRGEYTKTKPGGNTLPLHLPFRQYLPAPVNRSASPFLWLQWHQSGQARHGGTHPAAIQTLTRSAHSHGLDILLVSWLTPTYRMNMSYLAMNNFRVAADQHKTISHG